MYFLAGALDIARDMDILLMSVILLLSTLVIRYAFCCSCICVCVCACVRADNWQTEVT